jgi:glucose/mannose transport system permease protein
MFSAARIDGGGFWSIFGYVLLPISTPIVIVAVILQFTGSWNDYLFGLIFAGRENQPMTVLLTSIVTSQYGEKEYNVNMAATMLAAMVPLLVYFASGRWFVRGISDGALKG